MAKANSTPNAEQVAKLLDYCPNSGTFTRKTRTSNSIKIGEQAGCINAYGYRQIKVCGGRFYASRLAWLLTYGEWPDGQIDHINHVRDDDRIENLRIVTSGGNNRNRSRASNNASGVTGVHWLNGRKCWRANITVRGKRIHLYHGTNFDEAVRSRKAAERRYGFHSKHGCVNGLDS